MSTTVARSRRIHGIDNDSIEANIWAAWMQQVAKITGRYCRRSPGDDPFSYNEAASVSTLASGAACAGYSVLAEYCTIKKAKAGVSRLATAVEKTRSSAVPPRKNGPGRGDLYISTDDTDWVFEFKHILAFSAPRVDGRLKSYLKAARDCAAQTRKSDAASSVAGLIVSLSFIKDDVARKKARTNITEFAKQNCDYAWCVSVPTSQTEAYMLFKIVRPRSDR